MRDLVFGVVVYPEAVDFLKDFSSSMEAQTTHDFLLLIIDESVDHEVIRSELGKDIAYHIEDAPAQESKLGHRIRMLRCAYEMEARLLVIGDVDDTFSPNRIDAVMHMHQKKMEAFYYNPLKYPGQKEDIPLPAKIETVDGILQSSFLGMSNTAINIQRLSVEFIDSLSECRSPIFDWYLHSRMLLNIGSGILVPDAYTTYRLYEGNIAGIRDGTENNIARELKVKKDHYSLLKKYDDRFAVLLDALEEGRYKVQQDVDKQGGSYWWNLLYVEM